MDIEEFRRCVRYGLGRPIIYLQDHDVAPYQECILDACLHNTVYDPQSEGNKEQYLYEIIQLTQNMPFYRAAILQGMAELPSSPIDGVDDYDWDADQFFDLALLFARQGDTEFRQALYQLFIRRASRHCEFGADQIIELDGLDGFLFVARHLCNINDNDPDSELATWYLDTIEQRFGRERTLAFIEQATKTEARLRSFINYPRRKKAAADDTNKHEADSYAYVQQLITAWKEQTDHARLPWTTHRRRLMMWGRRAPEEEIRHAAQDLLQASRDDISLYLAIFHERPFPLDYRILLQWTTDADPDIAASAMTVLMPVRAPEVRTLALQQLYDPARQDQGLKLLRNNYQDGDHRLIEQVLASTNDTDMIHNIAGDILAIFEHNQTPDSQQILLQLYERNPCSYCREKTVRILLEQQFLPEHIARECQHDSNHTIREMMTGHNEKSA